MAKIPPIGSQRPHPPMHPTEPSHSLKTLSTKVKTSVQVRPHIPTYQGHPPTGAGLITATARTHIQPLTPTVTRKPPTNDKTTRAKSSKVFSSRLKVRG